MTDKFYLSGGSALALQLGHRESEDLDFFSKDSFDAERLLAKLKVLGELDSIQVEDDTLNLKFNGMQLQFLGYPYRLLEPVLGFNGIKISSVVDIACTKLVTISSRGFKKDFVDLGVLLGRFDLEELFEKLAEKYKGLNYDKVHILKSLVYFEDAESLPMPRMYVDLDWEEVKGRIQAAVRGVNLG